MGVACVSRAVRAKNGGTDEGDGSDHPARSHEAVCHLGSGSYTPELHTQVTDSTFRDDYSGVARPYTRGAVRPWHSSTLWRTLSNSLSSFDRATSVCTPFFTATPPRLVTRHVRFGMPVLGNIYFAIYKWTDTSRPSSQLSHSRMTRVAFTCDSETTTTVNGV